MDVDVKNPSELTRAESEIWHAFQDADPALHSPYFSLEFARACHRVRPDTQVAVLSSKGAIKGFLPFHRAALGYALPLGGPLGDFQGLICQKGLALDMREVMRGAGISVYPFSFIPQEQSCFSSCFESQEGCHTADISNGYEPWYEGRLEAHKKSLKKYEGKARKLEKEHGSLSFTMEDNDPAVFETLLKWKSAQYHATGFFDVFSVPWTSALLRAIRETKSPHFAGQLSTLRAGNTLVAVHFGMKAQKAAHYWFPAYDPDFARYGTGNTLLLKMIQHHAEAGIRKVHLGVGDFRYKHQFGGEIVPLCAGSAMSPSPAAFFRQGAIAVQRGFESLPLGPVSRLPGRVLRRFDREMAFHAT